MESITKINHGAPTENLGYLLASIFTPSNISFAELKQFRRQKKEAKSQVFRTTCGECL